MAAVVDPRMGLTTWTADSDQWPGRAGWNAELTTIFTKTTLFGTGTAAARPSTLLGGRIYWATDTKRLFYDDGTQWTEVSPVGGGGVPKQVKFGQAGSEGTSRIAMRADATMPGPAWPVQTWLFSQADEFPQANFTVGSGDHPIMGRTITNAPAGMYEVGFSVVMSSSSSNADAFAQAFLQMTVDGVPQDTQFIYADLTRARQPYTWSTLIERGADPSMVCGVRLNVLTAGANARLFPDGSHMKIVYLGPSA